MVFIEFYAKTKNSFSFPVNRRKKRMNKRINPSELQKKAC